MRAALPLATGLAALVVLAGCSSSGDSSASAGSSAAGARHASTAAAAASATTGIAAPGGSPAPTPSTPTSGTPTPSTPARTTVPANDPASVPRPAIHPWPIPYGAARRGQMAAYSLRHYGEDTSVLSEPKVIVEHYTETATAGEAYNTFAPDLPDSEFHELPNTCAHFLVEPGGRIDQLVALSLRCRHTTGLNWTAIGIENVGLSDQAILEDRAQLSASLRLTRWLRCRYAIALKNVIGHNESLSSPYHHDRVAAFQHQTHSDWNHPDMQRYRALLARLPCA